MEINIDERRGMYCSADFSTICSLYYLGFNLDGFERDPHSTGKVTVCFTRTDELYDALRQLRGRTLTVEPLAFLETTRTVRGRLRDCA